MHLICAGDKLEGMLADEAAQQQAAAAEAAALQQQVAQAQQAAAAAQQQLEQTAAQLAEAQQALVDADRLHSRAVKKLDKRMLQLAQEYDMSRQELLIKSAEILDLQGQLREAAGQHEVQLAAAQDQVGCMTPLAACIVARSIAAAGATAAHACSITSTSCAWFGGCRSTNCTKMMQVEGCQAVYSGPCVINAYAC
jgi:anion-transporting  ArsA/GET3 family ATPase